MMELSGAAQEWWAMALLAVLLGARHGLDADHLATVDAFTRCNSTAGSRCARWCGALFSLGHGAVVVAAVALAQLLAGAARVPPWLGTAGGTISVLVLFALGGLNLAAVVGTPRGQMVVPLGLRGRWFAALTGTAKPWLVAGVGALFALSFDTLSQAMVFALTGAQSGAVWFPCALALLFVLGMVLVDGANGLWVERLLRRADAVALAASRLMGLAVALLSFAVGAMGMARLGSPTFAAWGEGRELGFGVTVLLTVLLAFVAGSVLARGTAGVLEGAGRHQP